MEKIHASLILEILGRPKENIINALGSILEKMSNEKGIKILEKNVHDPEPVEKSDLFTSFVELDVELDSVMNYLTLIFTYMPANIEITHPEKIMFNNITLNEMGNALVQRLHHYDAVTKNTVAERDMLARKLHEVAPHLFKKQESSSKAEAKEKPKKKSQKKQKKSR
ncbi:MAG: hypothetical protein ABH864_04145 [archaeon]